MMGLTSHISCFHNTFSSYRISFSFMTSLKIMVLGPGHLVRAIFHSLTYPLVVSVAKILFVLSVAQITLVVSVAKIMLVV